VEDVLGLLVGTDGLCGGDHGGAETERVEGGGHGGAEADSLIGVVVDVGSDVDEFGGGGVGGGDDDG
jgi:hypothetical protein